MILFQFSRLFFLLKIDKTNKSGVLIATVYISDYIFIYLEILNQGKFMQSWFVVQYAF